MQLDHKKTLKYLLPKKEAFKKKMLIHFYNI